MMNKQQMIDELREIFETLDDEDKWTVVTYLAWKQAATKVQHMRGCEWGDMRLDPHDIEVIHRFIGNLAKTMQWVIESEPQQ